ncbi:MAG: SsrA-binding protein SmpB [Oscillospiraceae bacterium]|nr:SsrA-binding protein SmpB [Oscillospiraceae bacterium]
MSNIYPAPLLVILLTSVVQYVVVYLEGGVGVDKAGTKTVATNRKAFHYYFIEDRYEAGISLTGTEVKSIRAGRLNLKDSFCHIKDGEMILYGMHISPYEQGNIFNCDPLRQRKLLLHKREILKLGAKIQQDGYSLIPLSVYFKHARVKVELGLARGKKLYDKRASAAERDAKRDMDRAKKSFSHWG